MSIKISITRENLLRSKVVPPGWQRMLVKSVLQATAKTDGSDLVKLVLVVVGGNYDGVPIDHNFSEKAPGFAVPFIEAIIGRKVNPDGEDFDMAQAQGREVMGYVKNEEYKGQIKNHVADFRAVTA